MLRTNLASRPFYNLRAVHVTLGALAVLVIAITLYNVAQVMQLSRLEHALGADATGAEAEAARLRAEAARMRGQIDQGEFDRVTAAVQEANVIIDRRTFSWTALLAQFETTLPADVRITRIQPREQRGRSFLVVIDVESYDIRDVSHFLEALERTAAFQNVRGQRYASDNGMIRGSLEALYLPPPVRVADGSQSEPAVADAAATAPAGGDRRE